MDFEVLVPEGYEVIETNEVVKSDEARVHIHLFENTAKKHAALLNAQRIGPMFRWVAERTSEELRKTTPWHAGRWAVVPYQNRLVKIDGS